MIYDYVPIPLKSLDVRTALACLSARPSIKSLLTKIGFYSFIPPPPLLLHSQGRQLVTKKTMATPQPLSSIEVNHDFSISKSPEKPSDETYGYTEHKELSIPASESLTYDYVDVEPDIHWRTYVALVTMFLLNYVAVISLQAPPAVVSLRTLSFSSPFSPFSDDCAPLDYRQ